MLRGAFRDDSGTKKESLDNIKLQQEFGSKITRANMNTGTKKYVSEHRCLWSAQSKVKIMKSEEMKITDLTGSLTLIGLKTTVYLQRNIILRNTSIQDKKMVF